jgi:hypothetical protein
MIIDFKGLVDEIGEDEIFNLANDARPGTDYLWNDVLPEVKRPGYYANTANMTIIPTMAKLVGMDSPYPRGGASRRSAFEHLLAKMAVEMPFPEEYLRQLRELVRDAFGNDEDSHEQMVETMFNFTDLLLVQPHLDTAEWLRGQALLTGKIDWQSDDIRLEVDYGIPAGNFLPARTGSDAYGGSTSKFWTDVRLASDILYHRIRAIYMRSTTMRAIANNPVNNLKIDTYDELAGIFEFQRYIQINGQNMVSEDVRDRVRIFTYDDEGEVLDETKPGTGETIKLPFCPDGAVLFVGAYNPKKFIVGSGAQPDYKPVSIGHTHVGPTEEGNGRLGRWAYSYVPEGKQWMFIGQSVTNCLPVIEAPDRLVIATTDV